MLKLILVFLTGVFLTTVILVAVTFFGQAPVSKYASLEASAAGAGMKDDLAPYLLELATADINRQREIIDAYFYSPRIDKARALYPVKESSLVIDGVYTEVFEPVGGIAPALQKLVLINLHGGGFSLGARTEGRLESIPVANVAGIKVISIDYRQGPEYRFPAASEDVAIVYEHLLRDYAPEHIGIFGCSAGGILAAQAIAWFDTLALPQPGAIGIFCAGAGESTGGDSRTIAEAFGTSRPLGEMDYFSDSDWQDPLVSPMHHPELLAKFPPTLVISSTRDFAMSAALFTHQELLKNGAESELHIYEGLRHYFFADTGLPESRQAFNVMSEFFVRRLTSADNEQY